MATRGRLVLSRDPLSNSWPEKRDPCHATAGIVINLDIEICDPEAEFDPVAEDLLRSLVRHPDGLFRGVKGLSIRIRNHMVLITNIEMKTGTSYTVAALFTYCNEHRWSFRGERYFLRGRNRHIGQGIKRRRTYDADHEYSYSYKHLSYCPGLLIVRSTISHEDSSAGQL